MESDHLIRRGDRGPVVEDLGRRLARATGTDAPTADRFDDDLERRIRAFQRSRGIAADGIVGPETWRNLTEAGHQLGDRLLWRTRVMMRGDDVIALQHRLNVLGFDAGPEDGIFGQATQAAVEEFQRNIGLVVDGTVGPATVGMLHRLHRDHHSGGAGVRAREWEALRRLSYRGIIGARILIDPSGGPRAPGVIGAAGTAESEIAWSLANRLGARLLANGAVVEVSRGPRTTPSPQDRSRLANELAVDLVVSIGVSGARSPLARGSSAYYFGNNQFVSETGRHFADVLSRAMVEAGWLPDCRTHPSTAPILRETRMAAVIVEPGFLTSPLDERKLRNGLWQDRLADALSDALVAALHGPSLDTDDPGPHESGPEKPGRPPDGGGSRQEHGRPVGAAQGDRPAPAG